jgi:hypothetical protein
LDALWAPYDLLQTPFALDCWQDHWKNVNHYRVSSIMLSWIRRC